MEIKSTHDAHRAMNIAFKLANKSLNKSRPRRLQCLAKAEKLIKASEAYVASQTPQP